MKRAYRDDVIHSWFFVLEGGRWGEIGVHRYTRILEFCRITRLELRSLERDKFTWLYGIKNK